MGLKQVFVRRGGVFINCWSLLLYVMQVLVVGHVPPGVCGRCGNESWMRPSFNKRFVALLRQYQSIIVATVFGHEHTDSFHVVYDNGKLLRAL